MLHQVLCNIRYAFPNIQDPLFQVRRVVLSLKMFSFNSIQKKVENFAVSVIKLV